MALPILRQRDVFEVCYIQVFLYGYLSDDLLPLLELPTTSIVEVRIRISIGRELYAYFIVDWK